MAAAAAVLAAVAQVGATNGEVVEAATGNGCSSDSEIFIECQDEYDIFFDADGDPCFHGEELAGDEIVKKYYAVPTVISSRLGGDSQEAIGNDSSGNSY